jgi:hypothetical protein
MMTMKELPDSGGFMVPSDFDSDSFVAIQRLTAKYEQTFPVPRRALAAACNGLLHRFRNSNDWNVAFVEAMTVGNGPPMEERYTQEMALFGFTSAAVSTIECCAFGAYCLGTLARPTSFPANADRDLRCYPPQVRDAFLAEYPTESVGSVLAGILNSPEYVRMADLRNVLTHRGTLPRAFRISLGSATRDGDGAFIPSNPKSINSNWVIDQRLDYQLTSSFRKWLGTATAEMTRALAVFALRQL